MNNFVNYHKHSMYSNVITPDSAVTPADYCSRIVELGQTVLSSVEHGSPLRYIEYYDLAKANNLKFLFGLESYIVTDRLSIDETGKKDATNAHIVLLAKNENGRKAINKIISQANIDGFYYKARIDLGLLFSLPKDDVWVTTACLAGIWKLDKYQDIILKCQEHFGNNFFLEVQPHHVKEQVELNRLIINLSNEYNIPIIAGMDSHYIYPNQAKDRDDFLLSRGIKYEDENNWFMDFPSYEEVYRRFIKQGALTTAQIEEALSNTLIFEQVEEYTSPIFSSDVKLPTIYSNKTQEEKDIIFTELIESQWELEKNNVSKDKWKLYEKEIAKEVDTIVETHMADYFLLDYAIVKRGVEMGGHITLTSRGSAPSFYVSKLLGFTTIDRISAEVKLFPERFITKERILDAGTLPDIDLNLGNPEVFYQAQKEVLGENNSFPMIAYGTAKPKAAWKIYARSQGLDFPTANAVSDDIEKYEMAIKHAENEEDRQDVDVMDYINKKYASMYKESIKYQGTISDAKVAPCGYLLYSNNIVEEVGLIRLKDNLCTLMDGLWAETYHFLKNDLLKVSVVELIYQVYEKIGVKPHTLPEIIKLSENNDKVWEVYKNAWTIGINQLEQGSTSGRVAKYAPKNISELSAFVAAIRPGFKSYYHRFENREPFNYGVPTLDKQIQTEQFPYSYMLYQENAMAVMRYAGIPISETYEVVKNIAKKRAEKVFKYKDIFMKGMTKRLSKDEDLPKEKAEQISTDTWQVIEDSSAYSFNSCISKDTKIRMRGQHISGFKPTVEEMFLIKNNRQYAIETNHLPLHDKYQQYGYSNALSMDEDFRIRPNKIKDIRYAGNRQTYIIKTSGGSWLSCTDNHKFPTPKGIKQLKEMVVGDNLYVMGNYEKNIIIHRFTDGNFESNVPKTGQMGFQERPDGESRKFQDFRKYKKELFAPCEICGASYIDRVRFEAHHKDFDTTNNNIDNLSWLCSSCHKKAHYAGGRRRVYEKGIPARIEQIVSIEPSVIEDVYDIEMTAPLHNFISESGLVVSNSHAYSVAGDGLYGAYLKSTYPLEFYEVLLNQCEHDGDKERLALAKDEAKRAYKIKFPPYRFGQDNREIVANKDKWEITSSLQSLKGLGKKVGEDMWTLAQQDFSDFMELLIYAEEHSMLYSYFENLIMIQFFEKFGGNKKLYQFHKEFIEGKNRYLHSHTDKTKEKRLVGLREYWNSLPNEHFDLVTQLSMDLEVLGAIQAQYNIPKNYLYITSVDTKYAPRVETYCLATGTVNSLKIRKSVYEDNPFGGNEIIKLDFTKRSDGSLVYFKKEPRRTFQDGVFMDDEGKYDWWTYKYSIVSPDDLLKIVEHFA